MTVNRREFVRRTARAALAAGSLEILDSAPSRAEEGTPPVGRRLVPIVDTHQHLWDLGKFRLPWLKSAPHINRSFSTKDYLEAARGLNVVKTVYMEVAVEGTQQLAEAEHVLELCRRTDNPMSAAVIGGQPGSDGFRKYLTRFKDSPHIKGVRQIIDGAESCRQKAFVGGIRLLGELGMSFDLCLPPKDLPAAADLVDLCPQTRFILDHCGNADPKAFRRAGGPGFADAAEALRRAGERWRRDIAELAKRRNVVCKISGIVAKAVPGNWTADDLAPIINHCIEVFGPERVMFGGDWPVCTKAATLAQWVAALKDVIRERPLAEQRRLLHDNAVQFYGLA